MVTTAPQDTERSDLGEPEAGTARWARLAAIALVLVAAGPLLMLAAGLLWGLDVSDEVGFFLATAIGAGLGAFLIRRARLAARIVAVVLGLAAGVMLFWTAFGLAQPQSFFDFVPGVLVLPGALLALVAGIGAIRAQRRGDLTTATQQGERRGIAIVLGLVGVLAVASGIGTLAGRTTVDDSRADAVVDMKDFEFTHDGYEIAGGSTVLVKNKDPFVHTFTVDALDIDVTVGPGSEKLIEIPDEPGSFIVYCTLHTESSDDPGPDDMAADLTVD